MCDLIKGIKNFVWQKVDVPYDEALIEFEEDAEPRAKRCCGCFDLNHPLSKTAIWGSLLFGILKSCEFSVAGYAAAGCILLFVIFIECVKRTEGWHLKDRYLEVEN